MIPLEKRGGHLRCRRPGSILFFFFLLLGMPEKEVRAQETVTLGTATNGVTPSQVGYNLGHFTDSGNAFDWFRYAGVKAARIFISASQVQGQGTSPGKSRVTNQASFFTTIQQARAGGTGNTNYIRWADFTYNFTDTSGANRIQYDYAFRRFTALGVEVLANITASPSTFPILDLNTDWAGKWELWQHYYAQAYVLSRDYGIRRFGMFNEPNNWTGMTPENWLLRLRICSDAIQAAVADMNFTHGKNLTALIYAPNTANGQEKYNTGTDTWGRDAVLNRRLQLDGSSSPSWNLFHIYNYQKYTTRTFAEGSLSGYIEDVLGLAGLIQAELGAEQPYPLMLTEYNVRTGANYDTTTNNQDTPLDYVSLGANSIALTTHGADGLYLFKFGQTESGGTNYGVAKNGTHYVQTNGTVKNYGGATKAAEVFRLFQKAAGQGRPRLAFTTTLGAATNTSTGLWTLATRDTNRNLSHVYLANKNTNAVALQLNLASLGLTNRVPVFCEAVGPGASGGGYFAGNLGANGLISMGSIPAQSVCLVTLPSTAAGLASFEAEEDAELADGTGKNLPGGSRSALQVRSDGTTNGRRVVLLKIPIAQTEMASFRAFYLDLEVAGTTNSPVQSHLYGLQQDSWNEADVTWAGSSGFLRQGVPAGSQISNNCVINTGSNPPARLLGQLVTISTNSSRLWVDVTEFVHSQNDGYASFLVAQDHRWDFSAEPISTRSAGDLQTGGMVVTSRERLGSGPRLIGITAAAPTNPPMILSHPADSFASPGGSVTLVVTADESLPVTYQWRKDGALMAGATNRTLVLNGVTSAEAGAYTVDVVTQNGTNTSVAGFVSIVAAPTVVTPLVDVSASVGDPVALFAEFSGSPPPALVWRKDGTVIPGADSSSYSFVAATNSGGSYSVTAQNNSGSIASACTVSINPAPTGFVPLSSLVEGLTENFDTLGKFTSFRIGTTNYFGWTSGEGWFNGTGTSFTNKPGWYAATDDNRNPFEGYRTINDASQDVDSVPTRAKTGLASMGPASSDSNRALGGIAFSNNRVFFGIRIINSTPTPIQGCRVIYTLGQYSSASANRTGTKMVASTAVNPATLRSPGWINFATTPPFVISSRNNYYGGLDGTLSANSRRLTNQITNLSVAPGDSLWIRWEVSTTNAYPLAMAIDDLLVTNFVAATAPVITGQPSGQTLLAGSTLSLSVSATGGPVPAFQWRKNGLNLEAATASTLTISGVTGTDAGNYSVVVSNVAGGVTSSVVPVVVNSPPSFVRHPGGVLGDNLTVLSGTSLTLEALADGFPVPAYQWNRNGMVLAGQTSPTLQLTQVQAADEGLYSITASNLAGVTLSDPVFLTVQPPTFDAVFIGVDPGSDGDGDGLPALAEYALGGSTNRNDGDLLPTIALVSGGQVALDYAVRTDDPKLEILPERTGELSTSNPWIQTGIVVTPLGATNQNGVVLEKRRAIVSSGDTNRIFLRLKIRNLP